MSRQKEGPLSKVGGGEKERFLRLYVPKEVAEELDLHGGDTVRWTVIQEDGKKVAKFKKVRVVVSVSDV